MRIDRLDLIAYGAFTDKSLDLSEGKLGLHILYGDNEAGKSTSLRALIAWLFGIPARTNDNYLHVNRQLRIGGKIKASDGREIEFVRRKGTKGTLLEPETGATLDDSVLLPFLQGGVDENLFTRLYGIDHARLISGGEELLKQSGDLGQALFSAAVGTANFRQILSDLQGGAEEFFKPRGSTQRISRALSSFREAKKQMKESTLPVAEWKRLQKELADTVSSIQRVEAEIDGISKEKSRLDRINRVKTALTERNGVLGKIEEMGEVLLLSEDFEEKCKTAKNNLQSGNELSARAKKKLENKKTESASLNVRNELLDHEDIILTIYKELGAVETAIKDRPQQDGKRRLLRNEAEQLLKSVPPDLSIDDADQLRPLTNNKKWISGLAQQYSLLNQKEEKAEDTLEDIEDEQATIDEELNKQVHLTVDLSELKATVAAARKVGDLEQRLADLQKRASDEQAVCADDFARLGRFTGSSDKLLTTSMPMSETLDIFERQFDELSERIKRYSQRQEDLVKEQEKAKQDLQSLLLTSDVPTISELEDSRDKRDIGWNLIKKKYVEEIDVEKEINEFVSGSNLPAFYEQKIEAADIISDRLRLSADQVVKRADLEANITSLETYYNHNVQKAEEVKKENDAYLQEWHSIWEPLGVAAGTPREMKQWILEVGKFLSTSRTANVALGDAKKLTEDCKGLKESVSVQILKFDSSIVTQDKSLEALIMLCEQRVEREESVVKRRHQLEHIQSETEIRKKRANEDLASIKKARIGWTEEWGQAIKGLGLESDTHPEQANEVFDQLLKFFDKLDKSEELRKRIYGIDQVVEKFEKKVFSFSDSIGFDKDNREAVVIAAQLNRNLNSAREARASLIKIEAQEQEINEEKEDAAITIETALKQLESLRNQASVEADDELVSAGENSRNLRKLKQQVVTLEQELIRSGDGLTIQELDNEVSSADVDSIESELERVSTKLKELQENRDTLRDQRQTFQNEIEAKDGSGIAAKASENAEQQLATIASDVEQYLRLQIAALILGQRIEDYRKKNQAPVLARASNLFAKLTLGAYGSLRDELDKHGKPILLGVRANDGEVSVEGMSDGTRDQLFLSLRLATLEQHLQTGESMPLVVDDILIGFDDNRTRVCLEVLAELALSTQVLLFTHHKRVLEIADELSTEAGIYAHALH